MDYVKWYIGKKNKKRYAASVSEGHKRSPRGALLLKSWLWSQAYSREPHGGGGPQAQFSVLKYLNNKETFNVAYIFQERIWIANFLNM